MMGNSQLWVDKYRPTTFEKLSYHSKLTEQLQTLAEEGDFPHMLFYGPSGAGKKTRIMATLRKLYGSGVEKLKIDQRICTTPSGRKVEINLVTSNYHLELTPSDVGQYDRFVIQDLIKEVAQTQNVDTQASHRFKVIVLNEADSLSRDAQQALRRTMEKYMANIRVILCCKSTSKIMAPIRSRCLLVRVAAPNEEQMMKIMADVLRREDVKVKDSFTKQVAEASNGNLRKALLMLETACVTGVANNTSIKQVPITDWEEFIKDMAKMIIQEQNPGTVLKVRSKLYELLAKCIPADVVIKQLAFSLIPMVDGVLKPEVIHLAALYEQRIRQGSKAIYHLEAFVVRFQAMYKRWLLETLM